MDAVNERRLRPVYDFIDALNYKKALQEVDRVLKKQPDFQCARALKSLALGLMGREDESLQLLDGLLSEAPTCNSTLQAMTLAYKAIGRVDLIACMYEEAAKKTPKEEELLTHLFMSYVRINEYSKQKTVAQNLYKLNSKNPYYSWSVMSVFMQALHNENPVQQKILLSLAEKMFEKQVTSKKIESETEVELYLMILEKQDKFDAALSVIDGPLGKHLSNQDFTHRRKAELMRKKGDTRNAYEAISRLIENDPDQLKLYRSLMEMATILDQDSSSDNRYMIRMVEQVKKLTDRGGKGSLWRGPHLARLELFYRLSGSPLQHLVFKDEVDGFFELFILFGHKLPFYLDICHIFKSFPESKPSICKLRDRMAQTDDIVNAPNSPDSLQRLLAYHILDYTLRSMDGFKDDPEDPHTYLSQMLKLYTDNISFGETLPPTDINPSDGFLMVGVCYLLERDPSESNVIMCISTLQKCLGEYSANHTLKLLLFLILNRTGLGALSHFIFNTMDIKYIQFDTMQFIVYQTIYSSGLFSATSAAINSMKGFYKPFCKDTSDYTITCYKYGNFTRIDEIVSFQNKIKASIQLASASIDEMYLELIKNNEVQSTVDTIKSFKLVNVMGQCEKWSDNRDIRCFSNLPLNFQNTLEDWAVWSFSWEKAMYLVRGALMRCIFLGNRVVSETIVPPQQNQQNGEEEDDSNSSDKEIRSLLECIHNTRVECQIRQDREPSGPFVPHVPRIIAYLEEGHLDQITPLIETLLCLNDTPTMCLNQETALMFEQSVSRLMEPKSLDLLSSRSFLNRLVDTTETLSLVTCILCLLTSALRTRANNANKKGKKKPSSTQFSTSSSSSTPPSSSTPSLAVSINQLISSYEQSALKLAKHIKSLKLVVTASPPTLSPDATAFSKTWEVIAKENLPKAFEKSISELEEVIRKKGTFLKSLKL